MNRYAILLAFLCFSCAGGNPGTSIDDLEERDGLLYKTDATAPFTGRAIEQFEDGKPAFEGNYEGGKPVGSITRWFDNGEKRSEVIYNDEGRHEMTKTWHRNGQPESLVLIKDDGSSEVKSYYENGERKEHVQFDQDGAVNGPRISWYENGQVAAELNFAAGKLEGPAKGWFESGSRREEAEYKAGKPLAGKKQWHENGVTALELQALDTGFLELHWDEDSVLIEEVHLDLQHERHGPTTRFFPTGKKAFEGVFVHGKEHGVVRTWNLAGELVKEVTYQDGQLVTPTE